MLNSQVTTSATSTQALQRNRDYASLTDLPEAEAVVEMGGRGTENTPHMVTESSIRAFYKAYREIMGL